MSKRSIIRSGLLVGLLSLILPLMGDSQAQAAIEIVGEPFAYSESTTTNAARHIPTGNYPYSVAGSNWPQRIHGGQCTNGVSTTLKALYSYPGSNLPGWEAEGGNNFGLLRSCGNIGYQRLWTDAGTNLVAPWAGTNPGAWINPNQYLGWGLRSGSPTGFINSRIYELPSTCAGSGQVTGDKVITHMEANNPLPMHNYVEPVWGENCRDLTNWLRPLFVSRGHYTNAQVDQFIADTTSRGGASGLVNLGTTLFRDEFQITSDDMARIQAAEARGSEDYGLFLDVVADDFFIAYVNDMPKAAAVLTVDRQKYRVNSSELFEGETNLLAVQVTDKFWKTSDLSDPESTAGVAYQLVLYDDPDRSELESSFIPSASLDPSAGLVEGDSFTAEFGIQNSGDISGQVRYQTLLFDDTNNNNNYDSGETIIETSGPFATSPNIAAGVNWGGVPDMPGTADTTDYTSGKVCAVIILSTEPGHGAPSPTRDTVCVPVSKIPKLHANNGDVTVGANTIANGCEVITNRVVLEGHHDSRGETRSEFGAISTGQLNNFGSNEADAASVIGRQLTFANTGSGGYLMNNLPRVQYCLNDPFEAYPERRDVTVPSVGSLPSWVNVIGGGSPYVRLGGTGGVSTYTLTNGSVNILYVPSSAGYVDVNVNIRTMNSFSQISQIPRFIFLSEGPINIRPGVAGLYGIYGSNYSIRDCAGPASGYNNVVANVGTSLGDCGRQLVVNGSLYAGPDSGVVTWRTYTSSGSNQQPAEIFNLHPAVLMAEKEAARGGDYKTVHEQELPPRF